MKKIKVLIVMEGGLISSVFANNNIDYVIVDHDLTDYGEYPVHGTYKPERIIENMYELYTDNSDQEKIEIRDELKRIQF
jgi:hypothetical protein